MDIKQKIYWLMQAGITCFCSEEPKQSQASFVSTEDTPATAQATAAANQAKDLSALNTDKKDFNLSNLKKTAAHTILGVGNPKARLMCILDTPDADSDRAGQALSGAQGDLFRKMMAAIHLNPEKDVYVTYLSPWRTPGNRALTATEQALFLPFLQQEIRLVRPQKILLFGTSVAQALLGLDSLAKARGTWHHWESIPVRVTLALSLVNKNQTNRQHVWADLQEIEKSA